MNAADLPARVLHPAGSGRATSRSRYFLDSQDAANRACERVGWVTIHPQRATTTGGTTMTTTTTTRVKLSCHHSMDWHSPEPPQVGQDVTCGKCKPRADSSLPIRRIVTAPDAPGTPLESHDADVDREAERNATLPSRQEEEGPDAEVIQFPTRAARLAAAKAAARDAAMPEDKAAASERILAMPIAQAPVEDRSDTSPRPVGRVTGLKLGAARTEALRLALDSDADSDPDVRDDEQDAAQAIQLAVSSGAKRVDLDAPGVRVLLRNLHRASSDDSTPQGVVSAAGKAEAWLAKFAQEAEYTG